MSLSKIKAKLAEAYSRGDKPTFVSVMPHGTDEAWKLADIMLVVPVVPPDASPELEYALRLRRDALTGGICESCGATFAIDLHEESDDSLPMAGLVFPHKVVCPASDANAEKLMSKYRADHADTTLVQGMAVASKAAGDRIKEAVAPFGTPMDAKFTSMAETILDRLMPSDKVCSHLMSNPAQVWNTFIADGNWKCDQCWAYQVDRIRKTGPVLDSVEEFTCDLCRRYSPTSIEPLLIRNGPFVMNGGTCRRCRELYSAAPDALDGTGQEVGSD